MALLTKNHLESYFNSAARLIMSHVSYCHFSKKVGLKFLIEQVSYFAISKFVTEFYVALSLGSRFLYGFEPSRLIITDFLQKNGDKQTGRKRIIDSSSGMFIYFHERMKDKS